MNVLKSSKMKRHHNRNGTMMNIQKMMKQAQQAQVKMADLQNRMAEIEVTGQSGGGMVTLVMTSKEARSLKIDKSLLDPNEVEMLEDLLIAAINDAKNRLEGQIQEATRQAMGELGLPPGLQLPF
jgi:DNA-binding YbaB/EbfC family protein